jgi:amino acid adenylation domain-containing protein
LEADALGQRPWENMIGTWTLSEFLAHLRDLDVRLGLDGDRLTVSAPKGALSADLKAELQQRKAEILTFLRSTAHANGAAPPLVPIDRSSHLPLSFPQQRLWFLDRMEPGNPIYNIAGAVTMRGDLDQHALEESLRIIIDRHESLRTAFKDVNGTPNAVVQPLGDWVITRVSLRDVPEGARQVEVFRLAATESQRPFDLSRGPLVRATLYELGPGDYVLLVIMHHIAADGWSLGVFVRELSRLYPAFLDGQANPLEPLALQYGDYADWHRRWLESGVLASELPYWKRTLASPLPVTELPLDHTRPPIQTRHGHRSVFMIPEQLTEQLKQFSAHEQVTLFMTLFAAFQVLLYRYSGQQDVVVGTAVANRDRPELANLIGFFVNNLVLRTDLSGNPTVRECLARVRQVALDGFVHQDVPFDRLVEVLRPARTLDRSPLFQTMFILQNWPLTDLELPGVLVSPLEFDAGLSRFDLSIEAVEKANTNTLQFTFEFNHDLFDAASIARMQRHYQTLLEAMIAHPEQTIGTLPLLTPDERQQLLVEWNDTAAPYPDTRCVHHLIEAQAEQTPDAEAVRFGEVSLTYRELIRRANQLAHRLRALGVGPDTLVGVSVDRTHEMVVALLGVWKAGGAYVPLDPSYPTERLAFMAQDAGLRALITEASLLGAVPDPGCPVLCLDRDRADIVSQPETTPAVDATPTQLAYVIYTSGSTGRPKGVLLEHRSVVNFLSSMQRTPGLANTDCLFSVTTLSFDIAGLELYLPLITGARVVLASRTVASDGMLLAEAIRESGATVMQATPATWRLLLESGWREGQGLKLLCGGEALPRQLATDLLATGAELWNMYGPTETTIWSTTYRVDPDRDPVPIGRPIANTMLYVLDEHRNPVPVNVAGELYIGGAGLARGYHHRPELTAERFVANPFVSEPGARMYRTGDQVRYRADGTVEYMGRLDTQVKVRGFRIELGEIESVLATHERVRQAVVVVREDVPGDQRIVAYLVTSPGAPLTMTELRTWLSDRLPQFMIPSAVVQLGQLPLTPNGKVDRKALPAPQGMAHESSTPFVSPHNAVEGAVADIWRTILRVDRVGTNDNFFDLGGHSLLVVQLQSKLRERFQSEVSLMELFRRPTVAAIAEYLNGAAAQGAMHDLAQPQNIAVVQE